jgi:hypothetical protein
MSGQLVPTRTTDAALDTGAEISIKWSPLKKKCSDTDFSDQASLTRLGQQFGCFVSDTESAGKGFPTRLGGGRHLAVLAEMLTDELLEQPQDDEEQLDTTSLTA